MLDINFIRENIDSVKDNCKKRGCKVDIDELVKIDDERRKLLQEVEGYRQTINTSSKQKPTDEEIAKIKEVKVLLGESEERLSKVEKDFIEIMSWVPNMSSPDMPEGLGEEDNVEVKVWIPGQGYLPGEKLGKGNNSAQYMPVKNNPLHHLDLGEKLDIIDNRQSALTSGSRFTYLKNEAVILQYALYQLLSKKLIEEGFIPMVVPLLVKEKVMFGTSHFPEGKDQVYKIDTSNVEDQTELYLVGSSEPSLFAYYMDKVLKEEELPQKMFAFTTCFRSEVGSWGKDVRGIKRVHQFDKLEMDIVSSQEQSEEMFKLLLSMNEWFFQQLEIPYRIVNKCTRDSGYLASYYQYDIEGWLPGQQEFVELGTDTNATDFQARRMNIKYTTKDGERKYAHTINDTGCAIGRTIIAILENYQQEDGSVIIPEALRPYAGFDVIKPK